VGHSSVWSSPPPPPPPPPPAVSVAAEKSCYSFYETFCVNEHVPSN
jgi:hypothetical protein